MQTTSPSQPGTPRPNGKDVSGQLRRLAAAIELGLPASVTAEIPTWHLLQHYEAEVQHLLRAMARGPANEGSDVRNMAEHLADFEHLVDRFAELGCRCSLAINHVHMLGDVLAGLGFVGSELGRALTPPQWCTRAQVEQLSELAATAMHGAKRALASMEDLAAS